MNDFDIPIFKKSYDLYKTFYGYRSVVPKQDRYTIWQRCESLILDILEGILLASQIVKDEKLPISSHICPAHERGKENARLVSGHSCLVKERLRERAGHRAAVLVRVVNPVRVESDHAVVEVEVRGVVERAEYMHKTRVSSRSPQLERAP